MATLIPTAVERLLNAANGHDTDAFIAAFVEDARSMTGVESSSGR